MRTEKEVGVKIEFQSRETSIFEGFQVIQRDKRQRGTLMAERKHTECENTEKVIGCESGGQITE